MVGVLREPRNHRKSCRPRSAKNRTASSPTRPSDSAVARSAETFANAWIPTRLKAQARVWPPRPRPTRRQRNIRHQVLDQLRDLHLGITALIVPRGTPSTPFSRMHAIQSDSDARPNRPVSARGECDVTSPGLVCHAGRRPNIGLWLGFMPSSTYLPTGTRRQPPSGTTSLDGRPALHGRTIRNCAASSHRPALPTCTCSGSTARRACMWTSSRRPSIRRSAGPWRSALSSSGNMIAGAPCAPPAGSRSASSKLSGTTHPHPPGFPMATALAWSRSASIRRKRSTTLRSHSGVRCLPGDGSSPAQSSPANGTTMRAHRFSCSSNALMKASVQPGRISIWEPMTGRSRSTGSSVSAPSAWATAEAGRSYVMPPDYLLRDRQLSGAGSLSRSRLAGR